MSAWTSIRGNITVCPVGDNQHAKTFVLNTVLDHLPLVTGSEGCMDWYVNVIHSYDQTCNHDEFGQFSNLHRYQNHGWFDKQSSYIITLNCHLRDRYYDDTLKEFSAWLVRLSKRIHVSYVDVTVSGLLKSNYSNCSYNFSSEQHWDKLYEEPSWRHSDFISVGQEERCTDFRYSFMPALNHGNWCENLINLVPGGHLVLHELDMLFGYKDPITLEEAKNLYLAYLRINEIFEQRKSGLLPWDIDNEIKTSDVSE